jgi:hypothetical protein
MKTTLLITFAMLAIGVSSIANAQSTPEVKLVVESASPRAVESMTERSVVRDYAAAWQSLAEASEKSSPGTLNAYFVGNAKNTLARAITDQQKIGTHVRYLNQTHNLKAIFYSPEGDVMELQDAAEYQLQVVSDDKVIHDEHVVVQYLVLMTPGADRWVVRQLQAVPGS